MEKLIAKSWRVLSEIKDETEISPNIHEIVTPSGCFVLKIKDNEENVRKAILLLLSLSKTGVPVETPIKTENGNLYKCRKGKLYCLFNRIVGNPVHNGFGYLDCEMFGKAIARLHLAMRELRMDVPIEEMAFLANVKRLSELQSGNSPDGRHAEYLYKKANEIDSLNKEIIHRDPHPGNILFHNNKLAGFIDMELSIKGPRIFDITYCSTAILSSLFKDKRAIWPQKLKEVVSGYNSMYPLSVVEFDLLIPMAVYIQQLFASFYHSIGNIEMSKYNFVIGKWLFDKKQEIEEMIGTGVV